MMSKKLTAALRPLATYVNVTVIDPCKSIAEVGNSDKATRPRKTTQSFSIVRTIAKQRQMVSPKTECYVEKKGGLRHHYLGSLNTKLPAEVIWLPVQ